MRGDSAADLAPRQEQDHQKARGSAVAAYGAGSASSAAAVAFSAAALQPQLVGQYRSSRRQAPFTTSP
jgi:hypothetical protein